MERSKEVAIKIDKVKKVFRLPNEKHSSLKSLLIHGLRRDSRGYEEQHVLKGVSFEINKGDFFGIVGRNGSGKSTLLKMIAGIYTPTSGSIQVNGKLTPFIELGVGFNPELTGRENVFLNGALLGFNHKEMLAMYDDIVEFAEIGKFMDQKLKNYSSGMQVRLAFSIAIRARNDILVLDEVLAVGDEAFQQKCIDVFENYKAANQTIVLVTHSMETVRRFCNKAVLIHDGEIMEYGDPNLVAGKYSKLNSQQIEAGVDKDNDSAVASRIRLKILSPVGSKKTAFNMGDKMLVRVSWPKELKGVENAGVAIIKNSGEYVFGANTLGKSVKITKPTIDYQVNLTLGPGKYHLMAGLFGKTKYEVIDFLDLGPQFIVKEDPQDLEHGLTRLDNEWRAN